MCLKKKKKRVVFVEISFFSPNGQQETQKNSKKKGEKEVKKKKKKKKKKKTHTHTRNTRPSAISNPKKN